jgi:hypothetical protein
MSNDKRPDSEPEVDDKETNEAEGDDKKEQGYTDSAAPADDDIIIK